MLHVLLVILKVAGIVILTILLVLLLLLILVLFVPIRYKAYAKKDSEVYAKAEASWLFHILHFSFYYDKSGIGQRLRIFGIPIDKIKEFVYRFKSIFKFKKSKNKKSKKSKKMELSGNVNYESDKLDSFEDNRSGVVGKLPTIETEQSERKKQDVLNSKDNIPEKEISQKVVINKKNKKRKLDLKKYYNIIKNKLKNFINKIKAAFKKFIMICKNIKDKISDIKSLLQDERNKKAFTVCKEQLIVALKHMKPQKYRINLKFGTGDPALTGQIIGILGMLMPLYKKNGHFVPDFENVVFEGDIYLRGRVTLAKVLLIAWKLYRDKNVKRCYKMIMD